MTSMSRINRIGFAGTFPILYLSMLSGGCATAPRMAISADRYSLELALDPATSHLVGNARLDLVRTGQESVDAGPVAVEFRLHPDLRVRRVYASGARVLSHARVKSKISPGGSEGSGRTTPAIHRVILDHPQDALSITFAYEGKLWQDVAAGEKPGEIHNFAMQAHIGLDGIYLGGGAWYPEPVEADGSPPRPADFRLSLAEVPGMVMAVSAERDTDTAFDRAQTVWRTPYPVDEIVIVGGPHEVHQATRGDVAISVHLKPEQAKQADGLLETVKRILDRYEPLIGPYPAREYKIVDNFFSSGFAFPTMTLLSSAVIDMGSRAQTTHGYIDHEMLHSWWGNGVLVDPRDGNWCESITSYATNYYGYVLDGELDEARRKRRNYAHFLSRIKPEDDKPLGTYGGEGGCGRDIAYHKGAMVFHMLAREIGQDQFWTAMRTFDREYLGRHANWSDIQRVCEATSGRDLSGFFTQWVRRGGAPALRIASAQYDSSDGHVDVTIEQDPPVFDIEVPLRVTTDAGFEDHIVRFGSERATLTLSVSGEPVTVALDPDYNVFRKIKPELIIPTTSATRHGPGLTTVVSESDAATTYGKIRDVFESSFDADHRAARRVDELKEGELADKCVLILGSAVKEPYVAGFLQAIDFPVRWTETGFELSGVAYEDRSDALLCTLRHPGVPGGGITVVYANSESAIPRPFLIPMYEYSLVIFEDGRPSVRLDFEEADAVSVERR